MDNLCTELIRDKNRTIKWLIVLACVQTVVLGVVICSMLAFLNGYTFESTTEVTVDGSDGTAIYQTGKENTVNGQSESEGN